MYVSLVSIYSVSAVLLILLKSKSSLSSDTLYNIQNNNSEKDYLIFKLD